MQETYTSPQQLWQATKDAGGSHSTWYKKAVEYWDQQEASCNGVLGGFGHLTDVDIRDSRIVLMKAWRAHLEAAAEGKRRLTAVGEHATGMRMVWQCCWQAACQHQAAPPPPPLVGCAQPRPYAQQGPPLARLSPPFTQTVARAWGVSARTCCSTSSKRWTCWSRRSTCWPRRCRRSPRRQPAGSCRAGMLWASRCTWGWRPSPPRPAGGGAHRLL